MSTNISRRKVVAGAAWAAPVVAASAAVPAFASSTVCEWESSVAYSAEITTAGAKNVSSFIVPALVDKIKFEVVGGAGGTNYPDILAGSGAKVTGEIAVKPGQTVQLVAAAGGIGNGPLSPAEGGEGYGNGGSSNLPTPIPNSVMQRVNAIWPNNSANKRITYSASGGGSSALVIDGTPLQLLVVAAVLASLTPVALTIPRKYMKPGGVDAGYLWPDHAPRNAAP